MPSIVFFAGYFDRQWIELMKLDSQLRLSGTCQTIMTLVAYLLDPLKLSSPAQEYKPPRSHLACGLASCSIVHERQGYRARPTTGRPSGLTEDLRNDVPTGRHLG